MTARNLIERSFFFGYVSLVVLKDNHTGLLEAQNKFKCKPEPGNFKISITKFGMWWKEYRLLNTNILDADWSSEHNIIANKIGVKKVARLRDVNRTYSETKDLLRHLVESDYEYSIRWGNTAEAKVEFIDVILNTNDQDEMAMISLMW